MPMSPRLLRPRASGLVLPADADARAYVQAVNTADGQPLEPLVVQAIDAFVTGCKSDGIWSAIKASCILMGARTLSGALTPLVGTAPTNNGPFVSADYNRKTGLVGNGTSKYLNSNRASNADPQDNVHLSVYVSSAASNATRTMIGDTAAAVSGQTIINGVNDGTLYTQARLVAGSGAANVSGQGNTTGFKGVRRNVSSEIVRRSGGVTETVTVAVTSSAPTSETYGVFARTPSAPALYSADRLAFYSIGESLTLSSLDARVTTLYTAIGAAIP